MKNLLKLYEEETHPSRKAVYRAVIESSNNLSFTFCTLRRAMEAVRADMEIERKRNCLLKEINKS